MSYRETTDDTFHSITIMALVDIGIFLLLLIIFEIQRQRTLYLLNKKGNWNILYVMYKQKQSLKCFTGYFYFEKVTSYTRRLIPIPPSNVDTSTHLLFTIFYLLKNIYFQVFPTTQE